MDQGCIGRQGFLQVYDGRQGLIVNIQECGGVFGLWQVEFLVIFGEHGVAGRFQKKDGQVPPGIVG